MVYHLLNPGKVKDRRAALGLSQRDLCEAVPMSRATCHKIETGAYTYGVQDWLALRIARALECTVADIADGAGVRMTRPERRRVKT